MLLLVKIFFILCWVVGGFLALRFVGRRFFHEPRRAAVFAVSVTLAFLAGMAWPFSSLLNLSSPPPTDEQARYLGAHDVSALCGSAHFSGAVEHLGSIDGMGVFDAGRQVSEANGFVAGRGVTLWISGWAADIPGKVPAQAACLVIDGKIRPSASAQYGSGRPDVATAAKVDALTLTGFRLTSPVSDLPRGLHHVTVAVVLMSGEAKALASAWQFRIP